MVRLLDSPYEPGKRSMGLLKLKKMEKEEYEIVDRVRDKEGGLVWVCATEDGKRFKVKPAGEKKKYEEHPQSGKLLTVQFQELTKHGVPRFPVGLAVRDYE